MAKNQNNNVAPATQKTEPEAKKDALATALAQIEKQFGKGAVMKLGDNASMQVDAISTGSLGLDLALGVGGVPRGRIIEVYGPESSGKTTLALHILAEAQKNPAPLGQAAFRFNVKACDLPSKIDDMMANVKALEKQLEQLKSQMASRMGDTLLEKAIEVKGIKVLAARMDGAGPMRFFFTILMPLSLTNIAAMFVIQFIYGWNQYLWPLLVTTSEDMYPIVIGIKRMIGGGDSANEWNLIMATAMLAMIPPAIVVTVMQRWFVKGLVDTEK